MQEGSNYDVVALPESHHNAEAAAVQPVTDTNVLDVEGVSNERNPWSSTADGRASKTQVE
jgi:hypothetical protein